MFNYLGKVITGKKLTEPNSPKKSQRSEAEVKEHKEHKEDLNDDVLDVNSDQKTRNEPIKVNIPPSHMNDDIDENECGEVVIVQPITIDS